MSMYDLYRRLSLESLQAEADLRASQLADAYRANLATLAKQQLLAVRYGSTPDRAAWHQAEQQRLYAEYSAQLDDLGSQIEAQTAAIHADYDAKDQAYTDAMTALGPTPDTRHPTPDESAEPPIWDRLLSWLH
jgi:hypothetical protein